MRCGLRRFLFSEDRRRVVLINKKRPEWQAGLQNGIGGKVLEGEIYLQAMIREFKEETGFEFKKLGTYSKSC